MITEHVKGDIVTATMSRKEAGVLERALIIAKLHAGDDVVLGRDGREAGVNIEHLRCAFKGIANG